LKILLDGQGSGVLRRPWRQAMTADRSRRKLPDLVPRLLAIGPDCGFVLDRHYALMVGAARCAG
jgi:hypothetical protein